MTIYLDGRKPYFYIVEHKDTGKKYAGVKWGIDANPDTFMQDTRKGYTTSSATINTVLKDNPGVMYSILEVIEEEDLQIPFGCQSVQEYEQWFLVEVNCCKSMAWENRSVSTTQSHDSIECKTNMMKMYGVENCSSLDWIRIKAADTLYARIGYRYALQDPKKLESAKLTHLNCTGFEHALQNPVSMAKFKNTNLNKLGVEYPMQSPIVREKSIKTVRSKYGVDNIMQVEAIATKIKLTQKLNYMKNYGVENQMRIKWYCAQCDKHGTSLGNIGRWHKHHIGLFVDKHGILVEYEKC